MIGTLLETLLRLGHLVWGWTGLLLLFLRRRNKARLALTWRVGHDATEQITWPMANRWGCRLIETAVGWETANTNM